METKTQVIHQEGGNTTMSLALSITFIIIALLAGAGIGFYAARRYMMKYLKENPPVNEQMLRMMMAQMGRKPSEKQVKQMMNQMNKMQK